MADPHVVARGLIAGYPDPDMGQIPMHAVVPRPLDRRPGSVRAPAPGLDRHSRELLAGIGIAGEAYADLLRDGVVREPAPAAPSS